MAQSVERRIGSAEVTGSIPVGSLKGLDFSRPFCFILTKKIKFYSIISQNMKKT